MRPAVAAAGRAVVLAGAVAAAGGTLDCEGHAGVWQPSRGGCASDGRSGGGGSVEVLGRQRDLRAGAR